MSEQFAPFASRFDLLSLHYRRNFVRRAVSTGVLPVADKPCLAGLALEFV